MERGGPHLEVAFSVSLLICCVGFITTDLGSRKS